MTDPNNPKKHRAKKAAKEGAGVAALAVVLAVTLDSIRSAEATPPWDPSHDAALVGVATGAITALFRWLRKLIKHRRRRRGNPQAR